MKYIYHLLLAFLPFFSFGQLTLGGSNPLDITTILSGSGVSISNVQYQGVLDAIAYFSSGSTVNMPYQSGFLMTTGSKYFAVGPNDIRNAGIQNSAAGLDLANTTFSITSFDASVITFDVVPNGNTLKMKYVFGSEEFGNSFGYPIDDAFGIFISGPGISGIQNIARLPNQNFITISNLKNSQYILNNGSGEEAPYNSSNQYLQYNGLSIPLTASISGLVPGSSYHIILVITDAKDAIYDSGVFLEEGSITAGTDENTLDNFVNILYNSPDHQATIQLTDYQRNLTYSVVDLSGKTMEQSKITETTSIDLSAYSSGMYLIRVEGNNGKIIKKVIR